MHSYFYLEYLQPMNVILHVPWSYILYVFSILFIKLVLKGK